MSRRRKYTWFHQIQETLGETYYETAQLLDENSQRLYKLKQSATMIDPHFLCRLWRHSDLSAEEFLEMIESGKLIA